MTATPTIHPVTRPERLDDATISALREFAVKDLLPTAGAYATWFIQWLDREQLWRTTKPDRQYNTLHDHSLPKCAAWTDEQVAEALTAATQLTYLVRNERAGHIIDRHVIIFVNEASRRLKKEPLLGSESYFRDPADIG
jgi:hypothetical protein